MGEGDAVVANRDPRRPTEPPTPSSPAPHPSSSHTADSPRRASPASHRSSHHLSALSALLLLLSASLLDSAAGGKPQLLIARRPKEIAQLQLKELDKQRSQRMLSQLSKFIDSGAAPAYIAKVSAPTAGGKYERPGSPEELLQCLNDHQPQQTSTSWEQVIQDQHPYLKAVAAYWSRKTADVPLTLATQLSWNRKWQLKAMCRTWGGPIAAVLHMPVLIPRVTGRPNGTLDDIPPDTMKRALEKVAAFHARVEASQPCKMDLILLAEPYRDAKSLVLYPVNLLRNYARLMARTPLIGVIDVDLLVSASLHAAMVEPAAGERYVAEAEAAVAAAAAGRTGPAYSTGFARVEGMKERARALNISFPADGAEAQPGPAGRVAYVLPAFITKWGPVKFQVSLADTLVSQPKIVVQEEFTREHITRFDPESTGHRATNYSRWFGASQPYTVHWEDRYEPWVLVDRLGSTWADTRFRGYGKNKIVQVRALAYDGYDFKVHPSAFLVHRPHVASSSQTAHTRSASLGAHRKTTMYGKNLHLYNQINHEMLYGNYTVFVDPATAACRSKLSWWK
ncbi:hypothetical protein HYH03_013996 [Edaphochlamys debaryana]|uniref:Uncharacterized protein n=1 Tax=Edaphochlamys debaryana TaxID=47281 RepID=A0A835XXB1_9CHLO|nr:hypothetical protein HYH03_013996 [Edaphochlamys debaryana]|eukprot:KAG2487429.1 hypothetical protein HYH03_013996 [Edaphochlamys debaryana]